MQATRRIVLIFAAALLATACTDNPVGRKCFLGTDAGNAAQSIIASPALECPSRTCLHTPLDTGKLLPEGSEYADLCTAECSSDDECDKVPESPCQSGFTCAIPVVTGPFCCRKMCICKDYLLIPDGGIPLPAACDPSNNANRCCNLAGNEGLPECQ
jgi:hypothetical protein